MSEQNNLSDPGDHLFETLQRIQKSWGLTSAQMAALLHIEEARYEAWITDPIPAPGGPTIPPGADSAVPLIAIYKRLSLRLPDPEKQVQWLTRPHKDFNSLKPFDVALSSAENLAWLAYYLESAVMLAKDGPGGGMGGKI